MSRRPERTLLVVGSLFKRKPVAEGPPDPERLKSLLFDSVARGQKAETAALCRQHHEAIWGCWPGWVFFLMQLQSQPDKAKEYATSLRGIADAMAEEMGDKRFLNAFGG